jgi:enterochelin esterase family protein
MSALLERVQHGGNPIIDGDQATFVWQGDAPAPLLMGDFTNWGEKPLKLTHVERDVWAHTVTLPRDAYIEYAFAHKPDIEERLSDPHNARTLWNGVDSINYSFTMPDFVPSPLLARGANVKRGTVTEHHIAGGRWLASSHRRVQLYQPPVDDPVPLVVVWDGGDYIARAKLNIIVDNLIAQGRIRPIALACIDNGQQARMAEYFCNDSTLVYVTDHVIPYAAARMKLIDPRTQPGAYGALGASMGGLMALYAGLRMPHLFGQIVSQAGAFFNSELVEYMVIDQLVETLPVKPLKIWQDIGTLDWLLPGNRAMHERLVRKGYAVTYQETGGGHNYTIWSHVVGQALETVYGV